MPIKYTKATAIVTSDIITNTIHYSGLYIGGAGNVVVVMWNGDIVAFIGVLAGTYLPIAVRQIMATSTTATSMVGLEF